MNLDEVEELRESGVTIISGCLEMNQESLEQAWSLARQGVPVELHAYPHRPYNVGQLPPRMRQWWFGLP